MVRQLFEKMAPPNSGDTAVSRVRVSLSTVCWMLDEDLAGALDLEYSRMNFLKWKIYLYIFKIYLFASSCYKKFMGNHLFDMRNILGNISKQGLKSLGSNKQPYTFTIL